jgi:Ca2+-binding EF-hand superfamily protein
MEKIKTKNEKNQLRKLFKKYDINNDGVLSKSEIETLVKGILFLKKEFYLKKSFKLFLNPDDLDIVDKTVNDLLEMKDYNHDGALQWEEFNTLIDSKTIIETTNGI